MTRVVECHSGYTYAERPRAFTWEGERLDIETILAEWQTPESKHFRVITKQGQTFLEELKVSVIEFLTIMLKNFD